MGTFLLSSLDENGNIVLRRQDRYPRWYHTRTLRTCLLPVSHLSREPFCESQQLLSSVTLQITVSLTRRMNVSSLTHGLCIHCSRNTLWNTRCRSNTSAFRTPCNKAFQHRITSLSLPGRELIESSLFIFLAFNSVPLSSSCLLNSAPVRLEEECSTVSSQPLNSDSSSEASFDDSWHKSEERSTSQAVR